MSDNLALSDMIWKPPNPHAKRRNTSPKPARKSSGPPSGAFAAPGSEIAPGFGSAAPLPCPGRPWASTRRSRIPLAADPPSPKQAFATSSQEIQEPGRRRPASPYRRT